MKFSVDQWGSDPLAGNDDHWTGKDYDTFVEAEFAYNGKFDKGTAVITLTEQTPDCLVELKKRNNPAFRPSNDDDSADRHERAMQAGMQGGCEAYNDEMGYWVSDDDQQAQQDYDPNTSKSPAYHEKRAEEKAERNRRDQSLKKQANKERRDC